MNDEFFLYVIFSAFTASLFSGLIVFFTSAALNRHFFTLNSLELLYSEKNIEINNLSTFNFITPQRELDRLQEFLDQLEKENIGISDTIKNLHHFTRTQTSLIGSATILLALTLSTLVFFAGPNLLTPYLTSISMLAGCLPGSVAGFILAKNIKSHSRTLIFGSTSEGRVSWSYVGITKAVLALTALVSLAATAPYAISHLTGAPNNPRPASTGLVNDAEQMQGPRRTASSSHGDSVDHSEASRRQMRQQIYEELGLLRDLLEESKSEGESFTLPATAKEKILNILLDFTASYFSDSAKPREIALAIMERFLTSLAESSGENFSDLVFDWVEQATIRLPNSNGESSPGVVRFDLASKEVPPSGLALIQEISVALAEHTNGILVLGFADRVGESDSNRLLAQERAARVQTVLVARGIDSSRILAYGSSELSIPIPTADGVKEPENRRVEIHYTQQKD